MFHCVKVVYKKFFMNSNFAYAKVAIPVFILFCVVLTSTLSGQQTTNVPALEEASARFQKDWEVRMQKVRKYAAENNVLVRQILPDGKIVEMVDVLNGKPVYYTTDNEDAAISTRTNELYSGGSLGLSMDGSGYDKIGVWDGGKVRTTHQEFNNTGSARVVQSDGATSVSNHATHVAGTIVAGGVVTAAKGMAFAAEAQSYDWNSDDSEMAAAAAAGMELSNHSYGFIHGWYWNGSSWVWYGTPSVSNDEDYWFGFYSIYTSWWDEIAYDAPYYLIVKSAGNDRNDTGDGSHPPDGYPNGYDCIGTQGTAKNILTVGAVNDVPSYTGPASVVMSSFSGWGPADDGRIKPDIVGNGVGLYSSLGGSNAQYASYSGTSMSAPNVTGSMALLQQLYQNTHGDSIMRSSTLKALVINTADECGNDTGPDYAFGWGLLNTERAAEIILSDSAGNDIMREIELTNGSSYSLDIYSNGVDPLTVTVVWTDPEHPALPASLDPITPVLVNDLDLRLTEGATTYYPWKLDPASPSSAATNAGENDVDNVEQVYIASPATATYTITVDHDGTLAQPQYFSLIIRGGGFECVGPDTIPPVASCQDVTTCLDVDGTFNLLPVSLNSNSTDNCDDTLSFTIADSTYSCLHLGANAIQLFV
jgi:hypothetical protein